MYGNRLDAAFREGVKSFLLEAEINRNQKGFMCCPCVDCRNEKDYYYSRDIQSHLLRRGFMPSYNVWTKHGEKGVMMEDGDEEDNDENYRSMFPEYADTAMEDNEEEGGEERHQMSLLMNLVGPFLMQSDAATRIRRGCSSTRC